jgi:hypothetical protein
MISYDLCGVSFKHLLNMTCLFDVIPSLDMAPSCLLTRRMHVALQSKYVYTVFHEILSTRAARIDSERGFECSEYQASNRALSIRPIGHICTAVADMILYKNMHTFAGK